MVNKDNEYLYFKMIDGIDINLLDIAYCEIITEGFDFWSVFNQKQKLKISSVMDALNYFHKNGWIYKSQFAIIKSINNVYHFLLEKE